MSPDATKKPPTTGISELQEFEVLVEASLQHEAKA
jgi:hypothetical protein